MVRIKSRFHNILACLGANPCFLLLECSFLVHICLYTVIVLRLEENVRKDPFPAVEPRDLCNGIRCPKEMER